MVITQNISPNLVLCKGFVDTEMFTNKIFTRVGSYRFVIVLQMKIESSHDAVHLTVFS